MTLFRVALYRFPDQTNQDRNNGLFVSAFVADSPEDQKRVNRSKLSDQIIKFGASFIPIAWFVHCISLKSGSLLRLGDPGRLANIQVFFGKRR
jgi:hypothetical protein